MSITDFLAGIPVNAVLRERIAALLEDKQRLEKKVETLEKKEADLVRQNSELREEVARHCTPPDTIKHRGVIFNGVSKGPKGVSIDCARCGVALSNPPPGTGGAPMYCPECGFLAWFNQYGLDHVLSELPKP
jgi:hypothetical protein